MINEKIVSYEIAKNHHYIHMAPFVIPMKRGRRRGGIERIYEFKEKKVKLTVSMFRELDVADLDLLITLLAIGLKNYSSKENDCKLNIKLTEKRIKTNSTSELVEYEKLKLKIRKIFNSANDLITFEITGYELLKELNKTRGGKNYKWLEESLTRLSKTIITIDTPLLLASTPLIYFSMLKEEKRIKITLNPLNSFVILNDKEGYILINRKERLSLKKETSKLLHSILLYLVNKGQIKTFNIETLLQKLYNLTDEKFKTINSNQKKVLRSRLKDSLKEIGTLENWEIKIEKKSVTVKRK